MLKRENREEKAWEGVGRGERARVGGSKNRGKGWSGRKQE